MATSVRLKDSTPVPATPSTGYSELYVDPADSHLKIKDDAGTVFDLQTASAAITSLTSDVTATGPGAAAATVNSVGGSTAVNVNAATVLANAATSANTASAIVRRDGSGNFSAGTITASLSGNATNVTGVVAVANGGTNSSAALSNNRVMQSSAGAIVEAAAITAARALISDANGIPVHSAVTSTELGYVSGVTSSIQTQINNKMSNFSIVSVAGDVTLTANAIHLVSSAAARNLTLPAHVAGQRLYIKDSTGDCETNNFTLIRTGGGNIDGIADSRILQANWGSWHLVDDGTNWFIIG